MRLSRDPSSDAKLLRETFIRLGMDPDMEIKETLKTHKDLLTLSLKKDESSVDDN